MNLTNVAKRNSLHETTSLVRSREKILHCYSARNSFGFKTLDHDCTTSPFQATLFWNDLVNHFRSHIQIKQKRVRFRSYDSCFSGSEAVTLVYNYLIKPKHQTNNKPISRDNALKVCNLLLKTQVIQVVNLSKPDFEDSSSKLYRISTGNNDSLFEVYNSRTMPRKPQTEIMKPKNEQNLMDKTGSFKCSATSTERANRMLNGPKIMNFKFDQSVRHLEKKDPMKSPTFSVKDVKKMMNCGKLFMKRPLLSFNLFHKSNNDHLSDDEFYDSSVVQNEKFAKDRSKQLSEECITVQVSDPANDQAYSSPDNSFLPSSSSSSAPSASSSTYPSCYSSLSSAPPSGSSPAMSSSLSMHSISLDDVRISELKSSGGLDDSDPQFQSNHLFDLGHPDLDHDNKMFKQIVLSRLLKTIDLPFIESLVHPITYESDRSMTLPLKGHQELHKPISEEYCRLLLNKASDLNNLEEIWWRVSIKLLNLASDVRSCSPQPAPPRLNLPLPLKKRFSSFWCLEERKSEVSAVTGDDVNIKSKIFSTIVAEHRSVPESLWFSSRDDRLVDEISRLILIGRLAEARLASELSFQLLSWKCKDHVMHLLLFMRLCKMDASFDCKKMLDYKLLSMTLNNRTHPELSLEDCFEGCIIRGGVTSTSQSSRLLVFLVDQVEYLCRLPAEVKDEISRASSRVNKEYTPETYALSNRLLSLGEYEKEGRSYTEDALTRLVDQIIDSTQYSLKEKRRLLKKLRKHHSDVYKKYFRELL